MKYVEIQQSHCAEKVAPYYRKKLPVITELVFVHSYCVFVSVINRMWHK